MSLAHAVTYKPYDCGEITGESRYLCTMGFFLWNTRITAVISMSVLRS